MPEPGTRLNPNSIPAGCVTLGKPPALSVRTERVAGDEVCHSLLEVYNGTCYSGSSLDLSVEQTSEKRECQAGFSWREKEQGVGQGAMGRLPGGHPRPRPPGKGGAGLRFWWGERRPGDPQDGSTAHGWSPMGRWGDEEGRNC